MFFLSFYFFFIFFNTGDPVTEQSHSSSPLPPSARNLWSGLRVHLGTPKNNAASTRLFMEQFIEETTTASPPLLSPPRCNANLIFTSFIPVFRAVQSAPDLHSSLQYNLSLHSFQAALIYIYIYFRISLMKIGSSGVLIRLQASHRLWSLASI